MRTKPNTPPAIEAELPRRAPDASRRNERVHRAILDAAQALLSETGYTGVTIDQIAARASVGKATVYRWWPNKAAIFMELYNEIAEEAIRPRDTGSLRGDLQQVLRGAFKMFRTTAAGLALAGFVAEGQANPDVGRLLREEFAKTRRDINLGVLTRARTRGEISAGAPLELISDMITGAVYYGVLIGNVSPTAARADQLVEMLIGGIRSFEPIVSAGGSPVLDLRAVTAPAVPSGQAPPRRKSVRPPLDLEPARGGPLNTESCK